MSWFFQRLFSRRRPDLCETPLIIRLTSAGWTLTVWPSVTGTSDAVSACATKHTVSPGGTAVLVRTQTYTKELSAPLGSIGPNAAMGVICSTAEDALSQDRRRTKDLK